MFADVTSANVVGYAQAQGRFGAKILGAQFVNIGEDQEIDIQDLIPVGPYTGEYSKAGVYIQFLNENGVDTATYYFYDTAEKTGSRPAPARYGWYTDANRFQKAEGVTVKPGEGIYFYAPDDTWYLRSNGEVAQSPTQITLRFGAKMVVNPLPVPVDMQKISVASGYDPSGDYSKAGLYLQVLNENGVDTATFYFYDTAEKTGSRPAPARFGWYTDANRFQLGELTVQPGEGIYVYAPDDTWAIQFPGAFSK